MVWYASALGISLSYSRSLSNSRSLFSTLTVCCSKIYKVHVMWTWGPLPPSLNGLATALFNLWRYLGACSCMHNSVLATSDKTPLSPCCC